jgi:hypothetical protein
MVLPVLPSLGVSVGPATVVRAKGDVARDGALDEERATTGVGQQAQRTA